MSGRAGGVAPQKNATNPQLKNYRLARSYECQGHGMQAYLFSASNTSPSLFSDSIESLDDSCDDYFTVVLSESDFSIFLNLLGLSGTVENKLTSSQDFKSIFDLSTLKIPELSLEEFNTLYEIWLKKVGRESSMDEYGQLIFIQGCAASWNLKRYRFVLVESSE